MNDDINFVVYAFLKCFFTTSSKSSLFNSLHLALTVRSFVVLPVPPLYRVFDPFSIFLNIRSVPFRSMANLFSRWACRSLTNARHLIVEGTLRDLLHLALVFLLVLSRLLANRGHVRSRSRVAEIALEGSQVRLVHERFFLRSLSTDALSLERRLARFFASAAAAFFLAWFLANMTEALCNMRSFAAASFFAWLSAFRTAACSNGFSAGLQG